jgi:hypothetical protein
VYKKDINKLKLKKTSLDKELKEINNNALNLGNKTGQEIKDEDNLVDKIIDFGKIHEVLSRAEISSYNIFYKLIFIKKYDAIADSFSQKIKNFDPKSSDTKNVKQAFDIRGDLSDKSGDIEILFRKFDNLNLETRKEFPDFKISYSELARDVDFSKKYYSFPFNLTIEDKK